MSTPTLKITQLDLAGEGAWPNLHIDRLSPQLNVFYGEPRSGKSSVAQLVGHLLYGKSESVWRQQFGQNVAVASGSLQLDGSRGNFVLRRQIDANHQSRLTISSNRGDSTDGETIQHMLAGLSPQLASKVFLVDFAESPRADWLLNETFAREFSNSHSTTVRSVTKNQTCCTPSQGSIIDRVDHRRIDELVKRRDTIAGEIEHQMSSRRQESEVLERELAEVDTLLRQRSARSEQRQAELHGIEIEIADLETRLRYFSLDHYAQNYGDKGYGEPIDIELEQRELAELDEEITRCRQNLADLQLRESHLRTDLAQSGADGTADSVTCLADGRATLGALEQLLDDLDAEVSQLARANEPGRCIGHDSHAKISPVAALLRQQVYTLCGQLTEQERIVRRQQLNTELRQLTRVHVELGERLDLLLTRRESLIQRSQRANQPARLIAQPPAADHCRCEHHGEFIQVSETMLLGRADRGRQETEIRSHLNALQHDRTQLIDEIDALQREIDQLETQWKNLQRERAGLIGRDSIEAQQAELERLESVIRQSLQTTEVRSTSTAVGTTAGVWRASDILAQLTDGQLVQIRLDRHESIATIIDRQGQPRTLESLSNGEHDQLFLALTLSLVSSYANRGIQLPLILDEPFLKQNSAQAATMVGVLDEFARAGHQILVFTEDRDAQRRFATLNTQIFDLDSLRHTRTERTVQTTVKQPAPKPAPTPRPTKTTQTTNTRIVRETFDGHSTPALRLATVESDSQQDEVFFLTENSSFADFPVLGSETSTLFSHISIRSISELLSADADTIARQLNRPGITTETIQLWQIHTGLMCYIPNLTLDDAQILAASGIDSPEDFYDIDLNALLRSIEDFLRTDSGQRFQNARSRFSRSRLSGWQNSSRRYRSRWENSSRNYSGWRSRRLRRQNNRSSHSSSGRQHNEGSNTSRPKRNGQSEQATRTTRTERTTTRSERSSSERQSSRRSSSTSRERKHRFYLNREQDVEDAPSIGPKTAERLAVVGIRTVADLLRAHPESVAEQVDVSHIRPETIVAWQQQASLVCQIPRLRGYGAQLLVGCGLTEPKQIANVGAEQLVAQVLTFCETKEGQRILRSSEPPQSEKIAEWAELAMHSRPLEAA